GGDASAILGPGVVSSKSPVVCGERDFTEFERLGRLAAHEKQARQISPRNVRIRMCVTERLFAYRQCALEQRPRSREVALLLKEGGEVVEAYAVLGCSGPSAFSFIASARSKSGRAPARSPWSRSREARLTRHDAVSGCSGPSAFSKIASARSKSGRAPVRSPWSRSREARLLRLCAVLGCSGPSALSQIA